MILVTECVYYDTMGKHDQEKIKAFGWDVNQLKGEWFIRGRWASAVDGCDKAFTTRSVPLATCRLDELVLREDEALWPALEVVTVLDVVHVDDYKKGKIDGMRDAFVPLLVAGFLMSGVLSAFIVLYVSRTPKGLWPMVVTVCTFSNVIGLPLPLLASVIR